MIANSQVSQSGREDAVILPIGQMGLQHVFEDHTAVCQKTHGAYFLDLRLGPARQRLNSS